MRYIHSFFEALTNGKAFAHGAKGVRSVAVSTMQNRFRFSGVCAFASCALLGLAAAQGQNAFSPGGADFQVAGALIGDQTGPSVAASTNGGVVVWQDNAADGNGLGVRVIRLNTSLQSSGNIFRANATTVGDQEKPKVAMLNNGGAAIVWQGGTFGFQKIYARFLNSTGTNFSTGTDILVNTYTNNAQFDPCVATLTDGTVVVVWASEGQDGSNQGVYAQRLSSTGQKLGSEFKVNLFSANNQRSPAVAALSGGGFVVTWVSELQRSSAGGSIDIYARIFNASGIGQTGEVLVNTLLKPCANPSVAAAADGGFAVAWSQKDVVAYNTIVQAGSPSGVWSWDCYARVFNSDATPKTDPIVLNSLTSGDQYAPKLSSFGGNYLAVWSSFGQDNSWEGVYGQFLGSSGALEGVEFRVNSNALSRQVDPVITSDGVTRFLVCWSSFAAGTSYDLWARVYDLIQLKIEQGASGLTLSWNTQPGSTYQVQSSTNYSNWSNYSSARVAAGYSDSINVSPGGSAVVYRVVRTN